MVDMKKKFITKVYEILPKDGIFFDIGSNIGVYSLNMCRKAKDVYAFEATKATYQLLQETINENGIQNIHPFLTAIHNIDKEEVKIYTPNALNIGSNSMHSGNYVANTVQTITIDTFVEENNIPCIDFIKIDIEGNELNALQGAEKSIRRFRPIIMSEINPLLNNSAGYKAGDLYDLLVHELRYTPKKLQMNKLIKIGKREFISCQKNIFLFP
jgi:FkbM family methyltransferase